jgi:hypothetical protein
MHVATFFLLTCSYLSLLKQQHNAIGHKSTTCIQHLTPDNSNINCPWYQLHFSAPESIRECIILTQLLLLPKSHSSIPRCWYSPLQLWLLPVSQQLKIAPPVTQLSPLVVLGCGPFWPQPLTLDDVTGLCNMPSTLTPVTIVWKCLHRTD